MVFQRTVVTSYKQKSISNLLFNINCLDSILYLKIVRQLLALVVCVYALV